MKNKGLLILSIACTSVFLAGCETPWTPDINPLTFLEAYNQVSSFTNAEANDAKNVTIQTVTQSGTIIDKTVENITQYSDNTSSSSGTYTRTIKGEETFSTTYKTIKTKTVDKYNIYGSVYSYDMYTEVNDYDSDETPTANYKDSGVKKFIVDTDEEAEEAGLSSDQYILSDNLAIETSANSTGKLATFIADFIYSNVYLTQLGLTSFAVTYDADQELFYYSLNATYSYDGDLGNTVQEDVVVDYTTNKDKTRLESYNCDYMVTYKSKSDATDQYVSKSVINAVIEYGDKASEKASDILNPDNYFLTKVKEIGLLARNSNFDDVSVDANAIPLNCSYIFGYAKTYSPKKALDVNITPISSSNSEVVQLTDDGRFQILSTGTTTLTFGYYEKVDGVYTYVNKGVDVTITDAKVEKITFNSKINPYFSSSLVEGKSYSWDISVSPSKASKAITATSSDESVLKVSVDEKNNLVIDALKEGKATITVTSVATPEITETKEIYVLSSSYDYNSYLLNNSFLYDGPWGFTYTITFSNDGTGERIQYVKDSGETYTDTFKWTLEGTVIKFSDWSYEDSNNFETGTIFKFVDEEGERLGFYAETDELGKEFIQQN